MFYDRYNTKTTEIKTFTVNPSEIDMFLYQNSAIASDARDGVLLDNFICECKRGVMFVKETYVNCWSSTYTVYFARPKYSRSIYNLWDEFTAAYDKKFDS